jgi:hypothetical protein
MKMDRCSQIPDAYVEILLDFFSENREKVRYRLAGNCMAPILKDGDFLLIEHGNKDIRLGDIVLYHTREKDYAHRVVKIEDCERGLYTLKPDRTVKVDLSVPKEKIIGKVLELRGIDHHFRFDSYFWKMMNPIIASYSYASWRSSRGDTALWKCIRHLFSFRRRFFPSGFRISHLLLKGLFLFRASK